MIRTHHDFRVGPDGRIYVLMRRARLMQWLRDTPVLDDLLCVVEQTGESVRALDCISIPEAFRDSEFADMLRADWFLSEGDPFHTNSVEILQGRVPHPAFRSGNVLLSIRNMDCLAVLDVDQRRIVWAARGPWQRQHEARVTPSGYVTVFDNRPFDGQSRVVKYDVPGKRIVWSYTADDFFTEGAGAQNLLPNGNVLVTESEDGRLFEVTLDGRVVWEYLNPRTVDDDGNPMIVCFTRAYRVPYGYFTGEFGRLLAARRQSK